MCSSGLHVLVVYQHLCCAHVQGTSAATAAAPLPQHRFSPHDVVDLRPASAAAAAGPPLATGVVYRVTDASIIVAVDEPPEEGLNTPLRLEKLANEVR